MCPACATAAATFLTGASSAGGLVTLLLVTLGRRRASGNRTIQSAGDGHDAAETRDAQ